MAYRINKDDCISCGACESVCPVDCISEVDNGRREIDETKCVDCGSCAPICPVSCISQV